MSFMDLGVGVAPDANKERFRSDFRATITQRRQGQAQLLGHCANKERCDGFVVASVCDRPQHGVDPDAYMERFRSDF